MSQKRSFVMDLHCRPWMTWTYRARRSTVLQWSRTLSTGPYAGTNVLGADFSYVADFPNDGTTAHGFAVRPMATIVLATVGLRGGILFREDDAELFGDMTLTFHVPTIW